MGGDCGISDKGIAGGTGNALVASCDPSQTRKASKRRGMPEDNMDLAPIALFVYNRAWHAREVVEALAANELAAESELFVFSDGPRTEVDRPKVQEVRDYLKSITGFKKVTVTERERNFGCARNIAGGITEVVNRHGKIIVVEDDILTSPYFLKFMNEGLAFYEDDDRVACIHGFLYPVKAKFPETFFLRGGDIWGWATWKRGWDLYEFDGLKLLKEVESRGIARDLNFNGCYNYTDMLKAQGEGKVDTWDVQWYTSTFLHGKLTLFPGVSLVRNIGNDSSGTHCGTTDTLWTEVADRPVAIRPIPVREEPQHRKEIGRFLWLSTSAGPRMDVLKRVMARLLGWNV